MKTLLHNGHFGIVKIKNRARENVLAGNESDIENIVRMCDVCQQYQKRQPRETYIPHERPDIPWTKQAQIYLKFFQNVTEQQQITPQTFPILAKFLISVHSQQYSTRNEYFPDVVFPKKLYQTTVQNSQMLIKNLVRNGISSPVQFTPNHMGKLKEQYKQLKRHYITYLKTMKILIQRYFSFDQHTHHQKTHLLPLFSLTELYEQ